MGSKWYAVRESTRVRHKLDYDRDRDVDKLNKFSITSCGQAIYDEDRGLVTGEVSNCQNCFGITTKGGQ